MKYHCFYDTVPKDLPFSVESVIFLVLIQVFIVELNLIITQIFHIVAIVFGAWNCFGVIDISILSVASGIFSICMGIMVIANETRICGVYQRFDGVEFNRNKAIGYSM